MKKEIKRNIIIKNANQISKTAFKKSKNLSLTALHQNRKLYILQKQVNIAD